MGLPNKVQTCLACMDAENPTQSDAKEGDQAQHIIGDIKHSVMNDQETGSFFVNSVISKRAMQESDLLAFHIAISIANPSAVGSDANGPPRRLEWLLES